MVCRDVILRGVVSTHWIWTTYYGLTAAHDICAVLYVSVLEWDTEDDWPPLYGPLASAFSLRRFWGSFWHKLHIAPFAAYTPACLDHRGSGLRSASSKALSSLWVFLVSAICHALVNWILHRQKTIVTEMRVWLLNWGVCLLETMLRQHFKGTLLYRHWTMKPVRPFLGYLFLWAFFMSTVPAWQYPLLYNLRV